MYTVSSSRLPSTSQVGHTTAVVSLRGEFDLATREELTEVLLSAVADPAVQAVTVDLAEATFIDSETIGAVLDGFTAAAGAGKPYRLANASGIVHRVLTITGILDLPSCPDEGSSSHEAAANLRPVGDP